MQDLKMIQDRQGERGNVLFLILIAVALFAALSYAVTQSTRSGAGDTASETNLISSAQLTQYPAGIRTSVVRMIIGGVAIDDLLFNDPSDFTAVINTDPLRRRAVFHPQGGNATYQLAPRDVVTAQVGTNPLGTWFYNANVQIQNIGVTNAGQAAGNDLIAFLPNINTGICRRVNEEVGIGSAIPTDTDITAAHYGVTITNTASPSGDFPVADGPVLNGAGGELVGQPFGCFIADGGVNVYYHVLVER